MQISVLIADDHGVVAEGLRFIVNAEPDLNVVGCTLDSREALRLAIELQPDVAVIDHGMPGLNGTEATRLIRARCPRTRVIIISMNSNRVHVLRALQAGAIGYVVKKSAGKELVAAIRVAHEGRRYLNPELADGLIDQIVNGDDDPNLLDALSSRERQVVQLLAEGRAIADIAVTLSLSPKTVETYRARAMEKLHLRDFASLVRFAIRSGMTPLE